jgi:hypothetical protein
MIPIRRQDEGCHLAPDTDTLKHSLAAEIFDWTLVVWVDPTEIPQAIALVDVWNARTRQFEKRLRQAIP